ncbi:hypothetical protein OJF2_41230 [Aquisphaera giovannonii]|uniref:Putative restriction endonuclease domain-containing protein n=1 Tax=Aquisphaera giovannonii TaxID=406548 RepID=A0A5B9W6H5_9BACT|nr:Uma2 family endonuclease [Aquisphaera giovannonii]QEH35570.1 hypothetical protein OJF2_41230 [Aquisphaera giovannonii]
MSTIDITIDRAAQAAEVVYPDSDGRPMADNTLQYKWIVIIKENLEVIFQGRDDVFIAGDLLWYPEEGKKTVCMAPDVLVAVGRPKGYRGSYKQWEEEGIAPQVVFEVHSPNSQPDEVMRKLVFYDRHGVEEYYYYDPETGTLTGFVRDDRGLADGIDMRGFRSPRLGIRFEPGEGEDSLRIFGPDGEPFQTTLQFVAERDEARREARAERNRADEERARADRLAARLRELGVEPE